MFCGNCGKKIPDQAKFCPYCGAPTLLQDKAADDDLKSDLPETKHDLKKEQVSDHSAGITDDDGISRLTSFALQTALKQPDNRNADVRIFRADFEKGTPVNLGIMYIDNFMVGAADNGCDYHLHLNPGEHFATFTPNNGNESKTVKFKTTDADNQEIRICTYVSKSPYGVELIDWNKKEVEEYLDVAKRCNNLARVIMIFGIVSLPILIGVPILILGAEMINHKNVQFLKDELKRFEKMDSAVQQ